MTKNVRPSDLNHEGIEVPLVSSYRTTRFTTKLWITPSNAFVPLACWHWEYFQDATISIRYRVNFEAEQPTRLAALRRGFIRVNYRVNGGWLTVETMRWDRGARAAVGALITANRDSIDNLEIRALSDEGSTLRSVSRSFLELNAICPESVDELLFELSSQGENK